MATTIVVTFMVYHGLGKHMFYLNMQQISSTVHAGVISRSFSTFSSCFAKISVALLLKRMMNRNKAQEWFLYFIIISNLMVNIVFNIVGLTQCKPAGNHTIHGGCLVPQVVGNLGIFQGGALELSKINQQNCCSLLLAWSMSTDVVLALFPTLLLYRLQVKMKIKLGIAFLMSLGILSAPFNVEGYLYGYLHEK